MSEREERQRRLRESAQRAFKYGVELEERKRVCTKAFEDPAGRKIATEDIAEATFWNVYRFMEWVAWQPCTCADDDPCMSCQACDLLSSLKVQGPET